MGFLNKNAVPLTQIDVKVDQIGLDVGAIDGNVDMVNDKIGVSADLWTVTPTVMGFNNASYKHVHNHGYCIPSDGAVRRVTSSATANTFGAFIDVVPAGAIDRAFDIHWISITDVEDNGVYIVELHRLDGDGASEALLCQVPVSRNTNFVRGGEVFTQIPVQHAGARIGARMLRSIAGAKYIEFIAHYHDYQ